MARYALGRCCCFARTPAFTWGLIEDISNRGSVAVRLALTGVAASLGFILLDARITQLHVPGLDQALAIHAFSFAFTVFAVTGVAHSINIVDGLNGLAGVVGLLAAIGIAIVAAIVGDSLVLPAACALAASIGGFLLVNYPRGRIFLGDGGAYLVGLLLAELAVLLVHRNSEVSPWFPLVLLAYPVWETIFSMYRRKARGQSTGHADCAASAHAGVPARGALARFCGQAFGLRHPQFGGFGTALGRSRDLPGGRAAFLGLVPARFSSRPWRLVFLTRSPTGAWCASAFRDGS